MFLGGSGLPQSFLLIQRIRISHIGPPSVSDDLIRSHIRVNVGEPYSPISVDEDVHNLNSTGYFYSIRVYIEEVDEGVGLVYEVQGNPILTEILFEGNHKFNDRKLRKLLASKVGEPLDERKLFNDSEKILEKYQKVGMQKTTVDAVQSINEQLGQGSVTFQVTETRKLKIDDVEFVGAQAFSQKRLRKVLKTRRNWMFSWLTGSGKLKDDVFADDKDRLAEFYHNEGYIDFQLKDIRIDRSSPKRVVLRLIVSEGQQYQVGSVTYEGNELFSSEEIAKGFRFGGSSVRPEMVEGSIFSPKGLRDNIKAVQDFYESKGYLTRINDGDTALDVEQIANTERGTMDLIYHIQEGEIHYIEKIEIKGNTDTKDKVLRRELAVVPGEPFDMVRVDVSEQRLEGLGFFEKVDTRVESTEVPNRKNLVIGVEEKSTGNFSIGAGFSSVDALVGFAEITQGNFDLFNAPRFKGAGQKARLRIQLGTQRQDYILSFVEPWFLGRPLSFGTDLYHRDLGFLSDVYDQTETGIRLSLNKALPYNLEAGVSYTIENVGININDGAIVSPEIRQEEGDRLVSKIGFRLAHDTRNNVTLPNRGHRVEFLPQIAGGPLGADTDFYKLEMIGGWYFKGFAKGHVLELSTRIGVVETAFGGDRVSLFDRYYLGGLYSLRGYKFRHIGPKDIFDEPIGGNTYWFGGAEYSVPIIERLRFAMFYDIGNVYPDSYSFSTQLPGDPFYSDNWGIGFRLNIPNLGPLRLDYAFPITHDSRTSNSPRFQFGVSPSRDF